MNSKMYIVIRASKNSVDIIDYGIPTLEEALAIARAIIPEVDFKTIIFSSQNEFNLERVNSYESK